MFPCFSLFHVQQWPVGTAENGKYINIANNLCNILYLNRAIDAKLLKQNIHDQRNTVCLFGI